MQSLHMEPRRPTMQSRRTVIILSSILGAVFIILALFALSVLFLFAAVQPQDLRFYSTHTSLTQFTLASSSGIQEGGSNHSTTLFFDLELNFNIRYCDGDTGYYYDVIVAEVYYHREMLATTSLPPFYHRRKETAYIGPLRFKGEGNINKNADLDGAAAARGSSSSHAGCSVSEYYDKEKAAGVFEIEVRFYLRMRSKHRLGRVGRFQPVVHCKLKLPLSSSWDGGVNNIPREKLCYGSS